MIVDADYCGALSAMISAVARPMPLANAVMTATLSVNRMAPPICPRYSR